MRIKTIIEGCNRWLREYPGQLLSYLAIFISLFYSIGYTYLTFTSIAGLVFGSIFSLGGLVCIGNGYYFTFKNSAQEDLVETDTPLKATVDPPKKVLVKKQSASSLKMAFMMLALLLSTISCFFDLYQSTIILAPALGIALPAIAISLIAITFACIIGASALIQTWLQSYKNWGANLKPGIFKSGIEKVNKYLENIPDKLFKFTALLNIAQGIGFTIITLPSIKGIIIGCLTAICNAVSHYNSYFFTKNVTRSANIDLKNKNSTPEIFSASTKAILYMIGMTFINIGATAASFFAFYQGALFVFPALFPPLAPAIVIVIGISIATLMSFSGLIQTWLQTYENGKKILEEPIKAKPEDITPQKMTEEKNLLHSSEKKTSNTATEVITVQQNTRPTYGRFFVEGERTKDLEKIESYSRYFGM